MPDRKPRPSASTEQHPDKTCVTCGRAITWRKKWERSWDEVRFCSDSCRTHKPGSVDRELEQTILVLLQARGRDKTICPSEAARAVATARTAPDRRAEPETWQPLMEPARAAARRLVAAGRIVITQGGRIVDPSSAKGPIRLQLC